MKKVAVFGIGRLFFQYEQQIREEYDIVCLADNDPCKQGKTVNGNDVLSMEDMMKENFDSVLVVPNIHKMDIIQSLRTAGISDQKILPWFSGKGRKWKRKEVVLEKDCCHAFFDNVQFACRNSTDFMILDEIFLHNFYGFYVGDAPSIAIDIGMNTGLATLFLASKKNIEKVFAFEPFEETYSRAKENIALNTKIIQDKIISNQFALSNYDGEKWIHYDADFPGNMSILNSIGQKKGSVKIIVRQAGKVLSDIFSSHQNRKIIMKIDAEGSEYEIFDSMESEKLLNQVQILVMETHLGREKELEDRLEQYGFVYFSHEIDSSDLSVIYAANKRQLY